MLSVEPECMVLNNDDRWFFAIARYVVCILTALGVKAVCMFLYDVAQGHRELDVRFFRKCSRHTVIVYSVALAVLYHSGQKLYADDFHLFLVAYLIIKYPKLCTKGVNMTCGIGLACSYVEGYLVYVVPSDGADVCGIVTNLSIYEARNGVVFPVKRLFIILTKSMYSPPDLKEFNDKNGRKGAATIEACTSIGKITRSVAGVKDRKYTSTVYKINRPGKWPVYIAAECTGSLHTLYKVTKNTLMLEELSDVCVDEIMSDYVMMLRKLVNKIQELKDKVEVVYFDGTIPMEVTVNLSDSEYLLLQIPKDQRLADVLLARIAELAPDFEEMIEQNVDPRNGYTSSGIKTWNMTIYTYKMFIYY